MIEGFFRAACKALEMLTGPADLAGSHRLITREIRKRAEAPTNGTAVWISARINRRLSELYEMCILLRESPDAQQFRIDGNHLTASMALIGNLIIPREISDTRSKVWPTYCAKCAGMINYDKVYPHLKAWIDESLSGRWSHISAAGCSCP
jgi:hypothetical protein